MSKGRKRIVWALIAIMSILIAVATSLFIDGAATNGAISNFASAETTAAPVSASEDIMPASLLAGSDNYHAEGVHNFADGGWTELMEYDTFGKFYITEEGNYFLNDIPSWVNGLEFDVGGKITLCLNGHDFDWSSEEGGLIVGPDIDLHICDCGNGSIIGDITVEGGSLELDGVNLSGGTVTVEEGSSLKVAGNTQIGSVYLGDDVTIECGELDSDADINIEVDDNSERGDPYVDSESFSANNSGDVTSYFTMSDGSNPEAYRIKVVFPVIGSDEAPYKAPYGGSDCDWFGNNIKDYITFTRNSNGDEVTVDNITLDEDYTVAIDGESEMKNVGEYVVSVTLTTDGAKKFYFIGVSEIDPNFESGGECDSANGVATMPYEIEKVPITVSFNDLGAVYDGDTDWFLVFTEEIDSYIELDGFNVDALSFNDDFIIECEPAEGTVVSESGEMKNAGTYIVSVELSSFGNADNYYLVVKDEDGNVSEAMEVVTHEYKVERAVVKVEWNSDIVTLAKGVFDTVKRQITISASGEGITIDSDSDFTVTAKAGNDTGGTYAEDLAITEPGYYTFKVTLGSNLQFDKSGSYGRINDTEATHVYTVAETVSAGWNDGSKTYRYTGKNHFSEVAENIKLTREGGGTLQSGDYTVSVNSDNVVTNAGEYTVTITLKNYKYQFASGGVQTSKELTVTVDRAKLTITKLKEYPYNSENQFPEISAAIKANVKNELNSDVLPKLVEVTAQSIIEVSTYSVTVTLSADDGKNFEFDGSDSTTVTVNIVQGDVTSISWAISNPASGALSDNNYNADYDGKEHIVTATLTLNSSAYTVEITFDGDIIKDVDTYKNIKVEGTANYTVSATNAAFTAVISPYKIKSLTKPENASFNGSVQEAEELATIKGVNGEVLSRGGDYTVEYLGKEKGGKTPQNADTYTVTVKLTSSAKAKNYELESAETTYTIDKAAAKAEWSADGKVIDGSYSPVYDGNGHEIKFKLSVGDYSVNITPDVESYKEAKTYTFTAKDTSGNFTQDTWTLTITVGKAQITVSGATVEEKTYDGTTTATVTAMTFNGVYSGDERDIEFDGYKAVFDSANASASKIAVTITEVTLKGGAAGNYIVTGTFKTDGNIVKATIKLGGEFNDSQTYNKTAYSREVTLTSNSAAVSGIKATTENGLNPSVTVRIQTNGATAKTYANGDLDVTYSGYDDTNYIIDDEVAYNIEISKATIKVSGDYTGLKSYNGEGYSDEITAETAADKGLEFETSDESFTINVSVTEVNHGEYTKVGGKVGVSYSYDTENYSAPRGRGNLHRHNKQGKTYGDGAYSRKGLRQHQCSKDRLYKSKSCNRV